MTITSKLTSFVATSLPMAVYALIAAVVVFVGQYPRQVINALGVSSLNESETIYGSTSQQISEWLNTLSQLPYASEVVTLLFWAVVAVVVYRSYIYANNVFIFLHNEAILQNEYQDAAKRESIFLKAVKRLSMAFAYLIYVVVAFWLILPACVSLMGKFVDADFTLSTLPYLFAGLVLVTIMFYVMFVWTKLVILYEKAL